MQKCSADNLFPWGDSGVDTINVRFQPFLSYNLSILCILHLLNSERVGGGFLDWCDDIVVKCLSFITSFFSHFRRRKEVAVGFFNVAVCVAEPDERTPFADTRCYVVFDAMIFYPTL